jgi:hypothetical protein
MNDLEFLRELFKDDRLHIGIGTITQLGLSNDGNKLRLQVNLLPENREIVCMMTWDDIGRITFPEVEDLTLVAFVDGHPDEAHVIRLLTGPEEPISAFAQAGHTITNSRPGKKNYIGSDTKVGLGRIDIDPTEPAVLGNVMLSAMSDLLDCFLNAPELGQCGVGPVTLDPGVITLLNQWKAKYVTAPATNVVSTMVFVDRGS